MRSIGCRVYVCGMRFFSGLASFRPTYTKFGDTGAYCDAYISQQRLLGTQKPGPGIRPATQCRTIAESVAAPTASRTAALPP